MNQSDLERELELLNNALNTIDNFTDQNNLQFKTDLHAPDVTERLSTVHYSDCIQIVKGKKKGFYLVSEAFNVKCFRFCFLHDHHVLPHQQHPGPHRPGHHPHHSLRLQHLLHLHVPGRPGLDSPGDDAQRHDGADGEVAPGLHPVPGNDHI